MKRRREGITVPQVVREMGIEPDNQLCWSIGNEMRDLFQMRNNGALPTKELRDKTNEGGSHCFAIYPESYRPDIEKRVRRQLEYRKYQTVREPTLF
jgi:hypothetical protein